MTFRTPTTTPPNIRSTQNGSPLNIIDSHESNNLWSIIYSDSVNITGDEVKYIRVDNTELLDNFFGEYRNQILKSAYSIRITNSTLFESSESSKQTTFMTALGLVADQKPMAHAPKTTFDALGFIPRIGDCIFVERTNTLYRIQFVDDNPPHKFQGCDLSYEFKLKIFTANTNITVDENVKAVIPNIDFIETLNQEIKTFNNGAVDLEVGRQKIVDTSEKNGRV
jgi:hypothetical protein